MGEDTRKGGNSKGGGGINESDLRLWKTFTRDIAPLQGEEPDWEALEELIRAQKESAGGAMPLPPKRKKETAPFLPPQKPLTNEAPPQLDGRTEGRFRRGKLPIDGTLDLHGYTQERAHIMLNQYVIDAYRQGKRCLLIITGKGQSTARGALFDIPEGVLKQNVPRWLAEPPLRPIVLKAVTAQPGHGGSGALYVYLKRDRNRE